MSRAPSLACTQHTGYRAGWRSQPNPMPESRACKAEEMDCRACTKQHRQVWSAGINQTILTPQERREDIPASWTLRSLIIVRMYWIWTQGPSDACFWPCQEVLLAASHCSGVWTEGLLFPMLSFSGFSLPELNWFLSCSIPWGLLLEIGGPQILAFLPKLPAFTLTALSRPGALLAPSTGSALGWTCFLLCCAVFTVLPEMLGNK